MNLEFYNILLEIIGNPDKAEAYMRLSSHYKANAETQLADAFERLVQEKFHENANINPDSGQQ